MVGRCIPSTVSSNLPADTYNRAALSPDNYLPLNFSQMRTPTINTTINLNIVARCLRTPNLIALSIDTGAATTTPHRRSDQTGILHRLLKGRNMIYLPRLIRGIVACIGHMIKLQVGITFPCCLFLLTLLILAMERPTHRERERRAGERCKQSSSLMRLYKALTSRLHNLLSFIDPEHVRGGQADLTLVPLLSFSCLHLQMAPDTMIDTASNGLPTVVD